MSVFASARAHLSLAFALLATAAFGQTEPAQELHQCLKPIPREGQAYERHLLLNQRVKDSRGQAEVIFVGDSITQGWEGNGKEVWAKYYAPRHALNLGIGSDHTQHVLWRLDHGNLDGLKPKVAVVLIGVNNIPDDQNTPRQVLEGVTAVVQKLREKLPETKVLLLGIFPRANPGDPIRKTVLDVNPIIAKLHDGKNVFYLDIGAKFLDADGRLPDDIMPDKLHPSEKGYEIWAEAVKGPLAELLK